MTAEESREILKCIEYALSIYWKNEGKLSAQEIRMKSLLSVARAELLEEAKTASEAGGFSEVPGGDVASA